jgi:hypothetical protein
VSFFSKLLYFELKPALRSFEPFKSTLSEKYTIVRSEGGIIEINQVFYGKSRQGIVKRPSL